MFEPYTLMKRISGMPHGAERLREIKNAIQAADEASAHDMRLGFRFDYIKESIFHGDCYQAILSFPELVQIFDEHPELEDDNCQDLMQCFKWVVENLQDFYQISREEIERYLEEFERRSKKYGHSLRVVYMKKCKFYLEADPDKVPACYEAFHRYRRGANSDCEACEMNFDMEVALRLGDEEEALRIAQPLLNGEKHCAEIPHDTYCQLAHYYLYKGDLNEANYYAIRCQRLIGCDPAFLSMIGKLLEVYSATDPQRGWVLFKQSVNDWVNCHNPQYRINYAQGAYRLIKTGADANRDPETNTAYTKNVLLRVLPLPVTKEGISLDAVRDYFYAQAKEQSDKLDARNGTSYYNDLLSADLASAAEKFRLEEPSGTSHGLVGSDPAVLAVTMPEGVSPTMQELAERLHMPEDVEVLSCDADEEELYLMLRRNGEIREYRLRAAQMPPGLPARPCGGFERESFEEMLGIPQKYLLVTTYSGQPQQDYQYVMELLYQLFPEMLGVIDMHTWHAYPPLWVQYAAENADSISPDDLFGIQLYGEEVDGTTRIWMTTCGLVCLGMRELVVAGASEEVYSNYVDLLDEAAGQCVIRNMLPDAGEAFGSMRSGEQEYAFCWADLGSYRAQCPELPEDLGKETPAGMLLIKTDDGDVLPTEAGVADDEEHTDYPRTHTEFLRKIRLAKQTFPRFVEALAAPYDRAFVRVEFEISEEMAEKVDYGIELLWTIVERVENGVVTVRVDQEAETLPDVHEGDLIEIEADRVASWGIEPKDADSLFTEVSAYMLRRDAR